VVSRMPRYHRQTQLRSEVSTTAANLSSEPPVAIRPAQISDQARSFLSGGPRYAVLATINRDGSPHVRVVWFLLRGDTIVINSRRGRRWPANLMRDARLGFAVEEGEDAVTLDGFAELQHDPLQAQADIAEMARRYDTPEDAAREIRRFESEDRITFWVTPTRIRIHGNPR